MEFLLANWYLVLAVVVSGALLAWPSLRSSASGAESVSTAEAVRLMNREKAVLIDVSEPAEYAAGHVAGSRNIPLNQVAPGHKELPSNKDLPLILVCAKGARSSRAALALRKAGHSQVRVLEGGLAAWRSANLPTQTSA